MNSKVTKCGHTLLTDQKTERENCSKPNSLAIGVYEPNRQSDGTISVSFIYNPSEASEHLGASNGANGEPLPQSPLTVIGHELQHVDDYFKGRVEPFVFNVTKPYINSGEVSDNGQIIWNPNGIKGGEIGAVETENKVRSELGLTLRTHYGGLKIFGKSISNVTINFTGKPGGSGHTLIDFNKRIDFKSFYEDNLKLGPYPTLSSMLNVSESTTTNIITRGFTKPKYYGDNAGTTTLEKR